MEATRRGVLSAGSAGGVRSTGISVAVGAGVPLGAMSVAVDGMVVAVGAGVSLGGMGVAVAVSLGAISVASPASVAVLTAGRSNASAVSLGESG